MAVWVTASMSACESAILLLTAKTYAHFHDAGRGRMSESTASKQLLFPKMGKRQGDELDRSTYDPGLRRSGAELMENAGREVVDIIRDRSEGLEGLTAAIVCGKGNNGGDGFVVARLLHQAGVPVHVFSTAPTEGLFRRCGPPPSMAVRSSIAVQPAAADGFHRALKSVDLIIDAIHGTGLAGAARADSAAAIEAINGAGPRKSPSIFFRVWKQTRGPVTECPWRLP